jgi:hypothetical protein
MTPSLYTTALGPLCHRTFDHFTSRPPPIRPGPCARALFRTARTSAHHVPSVQAGSLRPRPASAGPDLQIITSPPCRPGPCARALTRTAWTRPCPPDPAGTHCPTRFQPGPRDPPGARPVLPTASRPGRRGQDSRYHHRAILGVCVPHPPEKAIVDVLVPAPSRCRHVPRWGCWGGLVGLRLPRVRPLRPGLGTSSTPTRDRRPKAPLAGASLAESTFIGGPGQPHPPCCSPTGDANGVRIPWAALNKPRKEQVESAQVR